MTRKNVAKINKLLFLIGLAPLFNSALATEQNMSSQPSIIYITNTTNDILYLGPQNTLHQGETEAHFNCISSYNQPPKGYKSPEKTTIIVGNSNEITSDAYKITPGNTYILKFDSKCSYNIPSHSENIMFYQQLNTNGDMTGILGFINIHRDLNQDGSLSYIKTLSMPSKAIYGNVVSSGRFSPFQITIMNSDVNK